VLQGDIEKGTEILEEIEESGFMFKNEVYSKKENEKRYHHASMCLQWFQNRSNSALLGLILKLELLIIKFKKTLQLASY
jgi:pyridoxine/pyridoxamine 5'-phosphate oxidase